VISRPTTAQLVGIVRRELAETVAPAVDDPVARDRPEAAGVTEPLEHELASMHLSDVVEHYSVVSEALSRALEETLGTSSALEAAVVDLMCARLAHEQEVIGDFQLVGRG
jgi:hypothetical protein